MACDLGDLCRLYGLHVLGLRRTLPWFDIAYVNGDPLDRRKENHIAHGMLSMRTALTHTQGWSCRNETYRRSLERLRQCLLLLATEFDADAPVLEALYMHWARDWAGGRWELWNWYRCVDGENPYEFVPGWLYEAGNQE